MSVDRVKLGALVDSSLVNPWSKKEFLQNQVKLRRSTRGKGVRDIKRVLRLTRMVVRPAWSVRLNVGDGGVVPPTLRRHGIRWYFHEVLAYRRNHIRTRSE
ncbi:hypothetical protein PIB30_092190 [Stylosanthes scabra]|uniref:Uncharacterized protein n=1 Tax=Stylosanthes scabra TaxID=79078 RepID=A0ABU6XV37_9FABA|nr:hypothetical protein [Stylosanthes scabra]